LTGQVLRGSSIHGREVVGDKSKKGQRRRAKIDGLGLSEKEEEMA
jgi:hypothetical protein